MSYFTMWCLRAVGFGLMLFSGVLFAFYVMTDSNLWVAMYLCMCANAHFYTRWRDEIKERYPNGPHVEIYMAYMPMELANNP